MTCDSAGEQIDLYLYGELACQEEDGLEQHLHGCPACQDRASTGTGRCIAAWTRAADGTAASPAWSNAARIYSTPKRRPKRRALTLVDAVFRDAAAADQRQTHRRIRPGALGSFRAPDFTRREPDGQPRVVSGRAYFSTIRSVQPDASGLRADLPSMRRGAGWLLAASTTGNIERLMLAAAGAMRAMTACVWSQSNFSKGMRPPPTCGTRCSRRCATTPIRACASRCWMR